MEIKVFTDKILLADLKDLAQQSYGEMVKAVVDIDKKIIAVGGEFHADAEALLLQDGSNQKDLWGINIYLDKPLEEMIEFSSLINIRPRAGNRSMIIGDEEIKNKIWLFFKEILFYD